MTKKELVAAIEEEIKFLYTGYLDPIDTYIANSLQRIVNNLESSDD
jgi:hypothetical protein